MLIPKIKAAKTKPVKSKLLQIGRILLLTTPQSWAMDLADRFDYLPAEDQAKVLELIEQIDISTHDAAAIAPLLTQLTPLLAPEDNQELLCGMLDQSLYHNQYDMAELCIAHKVDPNHILADANISLLQSAAQNGSAQAVDFLLKAGADPCGETLLRGLTRNTLCAAFLNDKNFLAITELLIPRVNINCRVLGDATPLHMAACLPRRTTLTALLLEHRADPNAKDKYDQRPLDVIFQNPDKPGKKHLYKTALLLHTYGANITFETLPHIEWHFSQKQIDRIARERARRESDLVCIRQFCTPEQRQHAQTLKNRIRAHCAR